MEREVIHRIFKTQGLISIKNNYQVQDKWGLSMVYTPGVGKCCRVIKENKDEVYNLTSIENNLFIMSNGSNFAKDYLQHKPSFMLPELELMSYCYKCQANINAYPLVFDSNIIKNENDVLFMLKNMVPSTAAVELYEVDQQYYKSIEEELNKIDLVLILPENRKYLMELNKGWLFNKGKTNKALFFTNLIFGCLVKVLTSARMWGIIDNKKIKQIVKNSEKHFKNQNEITLKQVIIENILSVYGITKFDAKSMVMTTMMDFMSLEDSQKLYYRKFKGSSSDANSIFLHKIFKGMIRTSVNLAITDLKHFLLPKNVKNIKELTTMIYNKPELDLVYTIKKNYCAIITNGTAILGFGDIGPRAGMPVMEGKTCLFKQLGETNVLPMGIFTKSVEETVKLITGLADSWAGINLEDIASPSCFAIESQLKEKLPIPVFHDDQHGTAIVVLAGLINAIKVCGKTKETVTIVMSGVGAAGKAVMDLLYEYGFKNITMVDSKGAIFLGRPDIKETHYKHEIALKTNPNKLQGKLKDVIKNQDIFVGLSVPGVLDKDMVRSMKKDPIIFALANPDPEIHPHDAAEAGAFIVATGRSDFNNQVNNSLAFPGIFKGLMDAQSNKIDMEMKLTAAISLANSVPENDLGRNNLLPYSLDLDVAKTIAQSILLKEECSSFRALMPRRFSK